MSAVEKYREGWTLLRRLEDEGNAVSAHLSRLRDYWDTIKDEVEGDDVELEGLEENFLTPLRNILREISETEQNLLELRLRGDAGDD